MQTDTNIHTALPFLTMYKIPTAKISTMALL
jgi:hypothetical protein